MKGQFEGVEVAHNLHIENLWPTLIPKSNLDKYILAGVQRYLGLSEFALGINDVMDPAMERGARKVVLEIEAARRKNEDIQPILDKYADRAMKGRTLAVRLRCKARKHFRDMNFALLPIMQQITKACSSISRPEDIADIPGSPSFVFQMPRGIQTPPGIPPRPDEEPEAVEAASPPKGNNSGSHGGGGTSTDSNTNSRDKTVQSGGLAGGGLGGIQGIEIARGPQAIIEAKAENDQLDKLWRDTEAYWEGHLKNSIQLEMLANNRLRKFEAKIRKKKKDDSLPEPDPEDFIPCNYFKSVLVHRLCPGCCKVGSIL
ncbi:OLC1v1008638C1 [Oldenlandia corymbosa var. corymbosa]|uniref:OLC1v1008638C1 n=1 Tax=Oldenlandia corymbosa var. corymbosa TaxID=529605 RepID=A0AAV1DM41_OLDCO|nr:OLC1v1008638C1 [Oldenlandia corymbosa var. corymbosa]